MRHDWTLLCHRVRRHESGGFSLDHIIASMRLSGTGRRPAAGGSLRFRRPVVLVSQWTAEFDTDRRLHSAVVQLIAPDGERVLWVDRLELDLRNKNTFRVLYTMNEIAFVGPGTYEYHILLDALDAIGEWGRVCLVIDT